MLCVERSLRSEKGLTLVELLIAMVLAGLIMGVVWVVMIGGWTTWARTSTNMDLNMQSEAGLTAVASKLRVASSADASDPSNPLITVRGTSGDTVYSFALDGTDLKMTTSAENSAPSTVAVAADVVSFQMVETEYAGSYVISVTCSRSGISKSASTQVTIRR